MFHSKIPSVFALLILFSLVSCNTTTTVRIESDPAKEANIRQQSTFAWIPGASERHGNSRIHEIEELDKLLKAAVGAQLKGRGYKETAFENADLKLGYQVGLTDAIVSATTTREMNHTLIVNGNVDTREVQMEFEKGSFYLEIFDSLQGEILWKGAISAVVDPDQSLTKRRQHVFDKMAEMMNRFPRKS